MSKNKKNSNLRLAALFLLVVFGLFFLSILFKTALVFKESKFDGNNVFNILFTTEEDVKIVSFSPASDSISILKISKDQARDVSKSLQIPLDAAIDLDNSINSKNMTSTLFKSFFNLKKKNINLVDSFKLLAFSRTVSSNQIQERELTDNLSPMQQSTILSLIFTDPNIYNENLSIQVINATDIAGVGNRIARLLENIGGNVILVSGKYNPKEESKVIFSKEETYTINKVSNLLEFPKQKEEKTGAADVIIIIGVDRVEELNF